MPSLRAHSVSEAIELAKQGKESMVQCPAHDDNEASLHVSPGKKQPVVMMCHANCSTDDILLEARIDPQEILRPREDFENDSTWVGDNVVWTPRGNASHVYDYTDAEGTLLYQVLRVPRPNGKKDFLQRRPDPTGAKEYVWNMQGVEHVLYHLPEVLQAKEDGIIIFVVEGEKDVETLRRAGQVATTSPMGAGKWHESYSKALGGANVAVVADADVAGRRHARQVREELLAEGCTVVMLEAMNGQKDVTDHFNAGGNVHNLIETNPTGEDEREAFGVDLLDVVKRVVSPKSFVVPGVLATGDRLMITGWEGHGKTTFLRQFGVQCAAGINPFTGLAMDPKKVLIIDAENHPDQTVESFQQLARLCESHGQKIERGALTLIEAWDSNLDITTEEGHAWLQERIHAYRPDIVCIGPLYNLSARDLKDQDAADKIKRAINDARGICGTAFVIEHHAPHKGPMESKRSVRPYGSSIFLKWPDFGYGLLPTEEEGTYEFQKTRMPRVRDRQFPSFLRWGTKDTLEFPWMVAMDPAEPQ